MGKCVKRHLALLLCLMLCLSLFPAAAFAEGGETTANEITGGEPIPAERPEETAEADVVEEEAAVTAETEGVIPSEAEDVIPEEEETDLVIEEETESLQHDSIPGLPKLAAPSNLHWDIEYHGVFVVTINQPFQNAMCVLDIPGQLIDLSASREEMAFTERTKEAIKETWKKFIVKAWNEIIDDINENADASRFEAIWKWKSKGLSFSALKNWITSGNGKVDYLCDENFNLNLNYVFPVFPIDCSIIREFLDGGIRGYEGVRSSAGNPMLAKIGKLSKDLNCSTNHWNLNVKNVFEYSNESKKIWSLSLSEGEDFKLVFLNKDATFASMKDLAKDILTASPHCIIHFYALDGKEERRKVIAAYGNPRTDHVMEVVLKRKEKTSIDVQDIQEKKEKVKVRINPSAFMNKGHIYSAEATEILSWIRANLKEKWVDIEEIEQFASSGGILLVTSGTELSEKWNLKQKMILETVARLSCHKENIPKKWMLLNEASYSKLLSLGFKPLDSNYSRQTVRKMIENLEIDWKDFEAWLMLSKFESELKLTVLDNAFGFENNILPDHKDSAYSKAYIVWKRVKSIIESKGSRTNRFASMAFDESYGFFEGNLKDAMLRIRKDIQWGSIISWLNDNKVRHTTILKNRRSMLKSLRNILCGGSRDNADRSQGSDNGSGGDVRRASGLVGQLSVRASNA